MKYLLYISLVLTIACEEVVFVDLPPAQNLVVIEGWVTDSLGSHPIRVTRSASFSSQNNVSPIEDAQILVQTRSGDIFQYAYDQNGYYSAVVPFRGMPGTQYRILAIVDTLEVRSEWDLMPEKVEILSTQVESFEENDPNNPGQQLTIYYPKVNAIDPRDRKNFYRWTFYRNDILYTEPDPITIQNDRLFNGNLIPNNFQNFEYEINDQVSVQLQSISSSAHAYLSLLKSQITTLGTSSGTTPAIVEGNLFYVDTDSERILGFFGTAAISEDVTSVQ